MKAIHQSITDLQLGLFTQTPLPELTELKFFTCKQVNYQVRFVIIGESHKVEIWDKQNLVLAEVLACQAINPTSCEEFHHFHKLEPYAISFKNWETRIDFQANTQPNQVFPNYIELEFPPTFGVIPRTRIEWQCSESELKWHTLHTYPNSNGYWSVISQSAWKLTSLYSDSNLM